jgi:cell division transport system permease protein
MEANMADLAFAQAWTSLRRHSLVALGAVANIAVSLAILGGFWLMAVNLEHMARGLAEEATITLQLKPDADQAAIQQELQGDTRVKEAKYVSKDEALKAYAQAVNIPYADLKKSIANPLPNVIRVRVTAPEHLEPLVALGKTLPGVAKVRYQRDIAEKLLRLARGARLMGLILGAVMALAALLLVSTTIQLGVHSRRREIRIMQLVGATNGFIRAPFLIEGAVQGLLGGLLAGLLLVIGYSYATSSLSATLPFLELVYSARFLILSALGLTLCGVLFGVIGSLMGTRHYLKLV